MKQNYLMTAAFALLLFAGCSEEMRDPDPIFSGDAGVKLTFSAVINEQSGTTMSSRATATAWETGDVIGITCGTQLNIPYQYNSDASFTSVSSTNEIWVLGTNPMEVTAYYPYTGEAGTTPDAIEFNTGSDNQQTADAREQIDFLFSDAQEVTTGNSDVTLTFNHKMSRIKLTFQAGEGVELSSLQLYLIGLKLNGTFNTTTGEITVDDDSIDDIYYPAIDESVSYVAEAIVLPQTIDGRFYFQAGMGDTYYEVDFDLSQLVGGVSYNYTIVANEYSDGEYTLTITDQTQITDWTNEDGGEITPDPGLAGTDAGTSTNDWEIDTETITPTVKN